MNGFRTPLETKLVSGALQLTKYIHVHYQYGKVNKKNATQSRMRRRQRSRKEKKSKSIVGRRRRRFNTYDVFFKYRYLSNSV